MSFKQVKEFNETFQVFIRDGIESTVRVPEAKLRYGLIAEEFKELLDSIESCDIVELADALGDIKVVVIGAAQVFGISEHVESLYGKALGEFNLDSPGDWGDNELLTSDGQEQILKKLAHNILTNNIDSVSIDLAVTLALVDLAAETYSVSLPEIITAIHTSNMTKLGEDGQPIFRESDGKVMKGPNYVTPTASIERILFGYSDADTEN